MSTPTTKAGIRTCSKCRLDKLLKAFHKDASQKSGYKSKCAACSERTPRKSSETIKLSKAGATPRIMVSEHSVEEVFGYPNIEEEFDYENIVIEVDEPVQDVSAIPGFRVRGTSTLYDAAGKVKAQWVKTNRSQEDKYQLMLEAMSGLADAWRGKADPIVPDDGPKDDDLLNVFPLGDPHIGMFSWSPETGNNFDLKIAEDNLFAAVDQLVGLAPPAKRALVVNLGDFFHADGKGNMTTGGTPVDVDGRWAKVISVGIRVMRRIIDRCLEKHDEVHVVCEIGNHDAHMSVLLSLCLAQFYENEPRVFIDTSPAKFHWFRFGQNLIGITHGDTTKAKDLPGIMACDRAADWGETQHRVFLCGHVHHETVKEYPGVTVETFRTLAPGDAWHNAKGYRSGRDSKLIVLHREWGEVQRHTVGIRKVTSGT